MKSSIRKSLRILLCLMAVMLLCSGCGSNSEPEPTVPVWKSLREKAQYLTVLAEEEDFALLEECISLEYLDLSGSTCYDAILDYVNRHPEVEVVYTAPLGNLTLSNTETTARLDAAAYDGSLLLKQLKYLPNLSTLELPKTGLTHAELEAIQTASPHLQIRYTVDLLGQEHDPSVTELDLSGLNSDTLQSAAEKLALLPSLTDITLSDQLNKSDVKDLIGRFPHIRFHYCFDFFGKTVSTNDERIELEGVRIGDSGESEIRAALDILPLCTYLKLENCGISNEVMASIRDDYPNTKVVWRVEFGGQYSLLTDETTLRTVYGVENEHNEILKYCTGLKYIDMGHNTTLTDISFASYMPDLEILILSGSAIKNVDPLANCRNLVFLEMANCTMLEDISALKNCEKLRFLNIGFTKVKDLTPIEDLPLERFICLGPKMDKETQKAFEENHPDCWVRFSGQNPLSLGWKYDDIGETYSEYYKFIREIFDLDSVDRRLAKQAAEEEAKREAEEAKKQQENATAPESQPSAPEAPAPEPPAQEETPSEAPAPEPTPDPPAPDPAPEPPADPVDNSET